MNVCIAIRLMIRNENCKMKELLNRGCREYRGYRGDRGAGSGMRGAGRCAADAARVFYGANSFMAREIFEIS